MTPIGFSTLTFFTTPRGLTTRPTKEAICIDQSLVKQRTLINTSTMDTAVDAAVIRGRRCRGDSWTSMPW